MSRMSTDAPSGALSYEPEIWDVARVRHVEDTWRRAGQSSLVVAARHRASGELAAYTVLQTTADKPWLANQDDTLVAVGHRGHRLGMLIKIRNLRLLRESYPAVRRVLTYNAAENDHMLGINIALGFKPAGYDGEWQRTAAAAGEPPAMRSGTDRAPAGAEAAGRRLERKLPGVTNGTAAQTSICWRLKARLSRAVPMVGGTTAGKMPSMANDVRIEQLWIPDSLDAPDAADFLAAIEVGRRVRMQTWGTDDLAYAPQEKLLEMADPYERQVILVAKIDGVIVGTADIALPLVDNLDLAEFTLDILPEFRRQGVGRQLLAAAEHFARDEGRHTILIDTNHPGSTLTDPEAEQLVPGSGVGFVPLGSRDVEFARHTGYTLQHIEQFSSCALPLDTKLVADLEAEAEEANAGRYRLHHWTDRCPDQWLEAVAALENQAGEDEVPGPDAQEMVFDGGILREAEEVTIAQGRRTGGHRRRAHRQRNARGPDHHQCPGPAPGRRLPGRHGGAAGTPRQQARAADQGRQYGTAQRTVPGRPGPVHVERPGEPLPVEGQPAARLHDSGRDGSLAKRTPQLRTGCQLSPGSTSGAKSFAEVCAALPAGPIWNTRAVSRKLGGPKTVGCWKSTLPSKTRSCSCAGRAQWIS